MSTYQEPFGTEQSTALEPIPVHIASSHAKPTRDVAPEYSSCMTWSVDVLANLGNGRPIQLLPRRYRRHKARIYVPSLGAMGVAVQAQGSVTSPGGANVVVVSIAAGSIASGTYLLNWTVDLDGTVSATDINNFRLQQNPGGITLLNSENDGAVGRYPQPAVGPITLTAANGIRVVTIAAGTVGAQYSAQLVLTPVLPADAATLIINSKQEALMNGQGAQFGVAPVFVEWFGQQPCYGILAVGSNGPVPVTVIDEAYEES